MYYVYLARYPIKNHYIHYKLAYFAYSPREQLSREVLFTFFIKSELSVQFFLLQKGTITKQ